MINLSVQIKLILFSFFFGLIFSYFLEILNKFNNKYNAFIKILYSFLFVLIMGIIYFVGIQNISKGIFHIYSILSIIVGFFTYEILIYLIAKRNK